MSYFEADPVEAEESVDSGAVDDQAGDDIGSITTPSDRIAEQEGVPTEAEATPEATEQAVATDGTFDLDGVQLTGLTKEQSEALSRGVSLNKDYTTGKQQLADDVRNFNTALQTAQTNPAELRKYFSQEHLIRALGYDPSRMTQNQQTTPANTGGVDYSKFEPEAAAVFKQQQQAIDQLTQANQQLHARQGQYDQRFQTADNDKLVGEMDTEVASAMDKFPILNQEGYKDYNRQLILTKIAATPNRSALEIANEISQVWSNGKTPTGGTPKAQKVVGVGGSVPLAPRQPKTFEDGAKSASSRFGVAYRE